MVYKFVDTNIFIEIFIRSGEKSEKSKKLIRSDISLYTNTIVFSEVEWVLRSAYKASRSLIVRCLKIILSSRLEIENRDVITKSVNFYAKNNVDWTDCLNIFLIKKSGVKEVYSYDKGLNKFDWVKRIEP